MKVLDLDMDFFLTDACPLAPLGERPPESCARPYGDEQVIAFLEEQCGLSRAHPVPGRIFDTHDKALDFWLAQMEAGKLQPPFDVVHVDTHSDLAFGPPGTDFVLKAVLTRNPRARATLGAYREGKSSTKRITCCLRWLFAGSAAWRMCAIRNRIRIFRRGCSIRKETFGCKAIFPC